MKRTAILSTVGFFGMALAGLAQYGSVPAGANVSVRTNETIDVRNSSDGRIYSGVVDRDVLDSNGSVAIPRGSNAELIVRNVGTRDLAVDLESIDVNGHRYAVSTNDVTRDGGTKQGVGKNERTAKYVGGGALLGTIIGAIAGGGKGAAIGAAVGAAGGAGTQTITRGGAVRVPAESVLTFRLQQPLNVGSADRGYTRGGHHYHYNQ
ncbi:MAG: hypothetical protein ACR2NN_01055 [Bryobacteraceae bacterium]